MHFFQKCCPSVLLFFLFFLNLCPSSHAAEFPANPILRIETGMHTTTIWGIATDANTRYLVTASGDKTIRVWDQRTGGLVRAIRPPIGEGKEGMLGAVALSPDGETIAAGGWTGSWEGTFCIYLFSLSSGTLRGRITGLPDSIVHLAFSPDGTYLAATLWGRNGVRVYRTDTFRQVMADKEYGDNTRWASFDRTGRLVTASSDGFVRLYDKGFRLIARKRAQGGKEPSSVAFSPDGAVVAVGFFYSTAVNVLSGADLAFLFSPDTRGVDNGDLWGVAYSPDGSLYAGGQWKKNGGEFIRRWDEGGRGSYQDMKTGATNTIMGILPLSGDSFAFCSADPAFGVVSSAGEKGYLKAPVSADYRDDDLSISPTGGEIAVTRGKASVIVSVGERQLRFADSPPAAFKEPRTTSSHLSITDWKNTVTPSCNGRRLALGLREMSRSLAIAPDEKSFLLGTQWYIRLFDYSERRQKWAVPVQGEALHVNISGDGKLAVAALGDGTVRWYRMEDGKELLAFFWYRKKGTWALWSPSGYYDASAGGEDLIGWHVNRGKDQAADFFPASRFRSTRYRPDVIARLLGTGDEDRAVALANEESGRRSQEASISAVLPPVVTILAPTDDTVLSASQITVRYQVRSPSGEPVTGIRAFIDGRPVSTEKRIPPVTRNGDIREMTISLPQRNAAISLIADNKYASSEPSTVRIRWKGAEEITVKPKLYILAVGVSLYKDASLTLKYSAKDATDFADVLKSQKDGFYRDVAVKLLTDTQATKDDILDGLDWIKKETTAKDVAMVFFSGHGFNDAEGYYFLTANTDPEHLKRTALASYDIKNTVSVIAGKIVLFMDTCYAGNVMGKKESRPDITGVVNELASAENGIVIFASSTGGQYSLENPKWGHGAFTLALIEGIRGKANLLGNGKITVATLDAYVEERVKELTGGNQTPTTAKPQTIPDFPIAMTGK